MFSYKVDLTKDKNLYILFDNIKDMKFSKKDKSFMNIAIGEAKKSLKKGNYPVGTVLVIDGKFIGKASNSLHRDKNLFSHSEINLMHKYSSKIKKSIDSSKSKIEIYTTLEPCLMCLGSSLMHRVSRIIFSCPDPRCGSTELNKKTLPKWYIEQWPKINGGLLKEQSCELMLKYMKNKPQKFFKKVIKMYENI